MFIVLDTETTGIPKNYWKDFEEARMLQLSYLIVNIKDFKIIDQKSFIIKNKDIVCPEGALKVHHITDEYREQNGIDALTALNTLFKDIRKYIVKFIVCHGVIFDLSILLFECINAKLSINPFKNIKYLCTKESNLYVKQLALSGSVASILNCSVEDLNKKLNYNVFYKTKVEITLNPHDALFDCLLCLQLLYDSDVISSKTFWFYSRKIGLLQ